MFVDETYEGNVNIVCTYKIKIKTLQAPTGWGYKFDLCTDFYLCTGLHNLEMILQIIEKVESAIEKSILRFGILQYLIQFIQTFNCFQLYFPFKHR